MPSNPQFEAALAFVWQPDYDDPAQGYHDDPRDTGGGTKGGVIETTWRSCAARGLVTGTLPAASNAQLATVLQTECWGPLCDALPPGIGFLLFNGRMMTGAYPQLFQRALGVRADGELGPHTLAAAHAADAAALNIALAREHVAYLTRLWNWPTYGGGWVNRLIDAHARAALLISSK